MDLLVGTPGSAGSRGRCPLAGPGRSGPKVPAIRLDRWNGPRRESPGLASPCPHPRHSPHEPDPSRPPGPRPGRAPRRLPRPGRRRGRPAPRRGAGAPRLGLRQCRAPHPLHAAHAVPPVLDHQAVHLRGAARPRAPTPRCWTRAVRGPAAAAAQARRPAPLQLAHNQSGLRDYWAVAMLHGAPAESPFGDDGGRGRDRRRAHAAVRAGHALFLLQPELPHPVRRPGGARRPRLRRAAARAACSSRPAWTPPSWPPTPAPCRTAPRATRAARPPGSGRPKTASCGPGDAGLGASLDDMIAWERHIDATRDDPGSLYRRLSAPVRFADGAPAAYGFGLGRSPPMGHAATGHGGALRGWRSHRLHVAAERLSRRGAVQPPVGRAGRRPSTLLAAVLGADAAGRRPAAAAARVARRLPANPRPACRPASPPAAAGQVRLRYGQSAERLDLRPDGTAGPRRHAAAPAGDGLWLDRPGEQPAARAGCSRERGRAGATSPAATAAPSSTPSCTVARCRRRAVRRRSPAASGRAAWSCCEPVGRGPLGAAVPAGAGPHAARRLDAGVPARAARAGRGVRGGMLAGARAGVPARLRRAPRCWQGCPDAAGSLQSVGAAHVRQARQAAGRLRGDGTNARYEPEQSGQWAAPRRPHRGARRRRRHHRGRRHRDDTPRLQRLRRPAAGRRRRRRASRPTATCTSPAGTCMARPARRRAEHRVLDREQAELVAPAAVAHDALACGRQRRLLQQRGRRQQGGRRQPPRGRRAHPRGHPRLPASSGIDNLVMVNLASVERWPDKGAGRAADARRLRARPGRAATRPSARPCSTPTPPSPRACPTATSRRAWPPTSRR